MFVHYTARHWILYQQACLIYVFSHWYTLQYSQKSLTLSTGHEWSWLVSSVVVSSYFSCLLWCQLGRWQRWLLLYYCLHWFSYRHPIFWSSKKQKFVSRSSTEVEYRVVANVTAELCWHQSLLNELSISPKELAVVYCDNLGATYLCSNPIFYSKMKYVVANFHFVSERVQNGSLCVLHVASGDHLANVLTKLLSKQLFFSTWFKISVCQRSLILGWYNKT